MSDFNTSDELEMCSAWGCNGYWVKAVSRVIPLCVPHFADAHRDIQIYLAAQTRAYEEAATPDKRGIKVRHFPDGGPLVYYVSMPPHIKIGTTRSLERRMREFYVQPKHLLAVEPGGRALEASRHQQFAAYRVQGTELFKRNAVLDELIAQIASNQPDPWQAGRDINCPPSYDEHTNQELHEARELLGLYGDFAMRVHPAS